MLTWNAMRSKKIDFRMPHVLLDACHARRRELGINTIGRYFMAAAMKDIMADKRERLVIEMANASPAEQDELLRYFLAAPVSKPKWLTWTSRVKGHMAGIFTKLPVLIYFISTTTTD